MGVYVLCRYYSGNEVCGLLLFSTYMLGAAFRKPPGHLKVPRYTSAVFFFSFFKTFESPPTRILLGVEIFTLLNGFLEEKNGTTVR